MEGKRRYSPPRDTNSNETAIVLKKQKTEEDKDKQIIASGPPRTSNLEAPIMQLVGHEAEIYTVKFNPKGEVLASGSFDKRILLWDTYGECKNFAVLSGHKNAILELHWSADGGFVYSASADGTAIVWDMSVLNRVKRVKHKIQKVVNSVCPSRDTHDLFVTGSDDGLAKVWDIRVRKRLNSFEHPFQVTSVAFGSPEQIITGSLDNKIRVWDLRKNAVAIELVGHDNTITSLSLSPDRSHVLSNSMDNTLRVYDIRPYCSGDRCVKVFTGAVHGFDQNLLKCSWSPDGSKISAGSSDRFVTIWDAASRKILYKLPGHTGTVNEVSFHPAEPIIASCSADKTIYLGEIGA